MKKLAFLFGAALGFLLGSKVGPEPYAQVEKKVRELADRPEVKNAVETAKDAAHERVDQVTDKMSEKASSGAPAGTARSRNQTASVLERSGA
jgi:hypothetical protein